MGIPEMGAALMSVKNILIAFATVAVMLILFLIFFPAPEQFDISLFYFQFTDREQVVEQIKAGTLRQLQGREQCGIVYTTTCVQLPDRYQGLSKQGKVAVTNSDGLMVFFWTGRHEGLFDWSDRGILYVANPVNLSEGNHIPCASLGKNIGVKPYDYVEDCSLKQMKPQWYLLTVHGAIE
jgi:hypothetical protein